MNYKEGEQNYQIFNLSDMGDSLYLIFGIFLIVLIILGFIGASVWKTIMSDEGNDISEVQKSTKTLDEELEDILEDID